MLKTNSDNKKTKTSGMSKKLKILLEKQNLEYSNLLKFHNKQNAAIQEAKNERDKAMNLVSFSLSESLNEIKELIGIIIKIRNNELKINLPDGKLFSLLESIYFKLHYLELFCVLNKHPEKIDLEQIINSSIQIYLKEILSDNIKVTTQSTSNTNDFIFDKILFLQIVISLLNESLSTAKPNGEIIITAKSKQISNKKFLFLTLSDDGFGIKTPSCLSKFNENKPNNKISFLEINIKYLKEIVTSLDGKIKIKYNPGYGKKITLKLPYINNSSDPEPKNNHGAKIIKIEEIHSRKSRS